MDFGLSSVERYLSSSRLAHRQNKGLQNNNFLYYE